MTRPTITFTGDIEAGKRIIAAVRPLFAQARQQP